MRPTEPRFWLGLLVLALTAGPACAGEWPRELKAFLGCTPTLDGLLAPGEYADATRFTGVQDWTHEFSPTTDDQDLSLIGYVKHDGQRLYFAFDITDDVLYGIDCPRWLPKENPRAHELSPQGYPWFGDEMELLINASNKWGPNDYADGNGQAWQMVCNLTKSRLGGIGVGGLLEGEPRSNPRAWQTYQHWILTRAMEAVAKPKPGGHGYVIEWAINFNPCLEVAPGKFYHPRMGPTKMGLNIALGDLDRPEQGAGNFANFHHEDWFAGEPHLRTLKRQWGSLWIIPSPKPSD
jgi:SSS family solute:Na+ symporter